MRSELILILIVSCAFSGTAIQTDWSGGDGIQGPVPDWSDTFWFSDDILAYESCKLILIGSFTPVKHIVNEDCCYARSVCSADVDGDGDADIIGAAGDDEVVWWENVDGTGAIWTEHIIDDYFNGAICVYAIDVDGDGDVDVLSAASNSDDVVWWENMDGTGTIWTEHIIDNYFNGAISVHANDINGDGDIDVIAAAISDNDIIFWEKTEEAGQHWIKHTVDEDFIGAKSVFSSDIDSDGDIDIIGAAYSAGEIAWWENTDGSGSVWVKHPVDGEFHGAYYVISTDINGDGNPDILGAAWYDCDITWWENVDGTGTDWTEHIINGDFNGACSVSSSDMDGDGDIDVIGAAYEAGDITWWENTDGSGTVWIEHTIDDDFEGALSACCADIDGDGEIDVIGASFDVNTIAWWDILGDPLSGALESSILDAGSVGEWGTFLSNSQQPAGTSVSFQFRSSNDSSNMGAWSDTVFSPDTALYGILADSTRYLQYKVILEMSDPGITPELNDVAFNYSCVDIGEGSVCEVPSWSLHALENPSHSYLSVSISTPEAGLVELSLYDISGRVVAETSQEFIAGTHLINFEELSNGVYLCTMRAGYFAATEKIIVIE